LNGTTLDKYYDALLKNFGMAAKLSQNARNLDNFNEALVLMSDLTFQEQMKLAKQRFTRGSDGTDFNNYIKNMQRDKVS